MYYYEKVSTNDDVKRNKDEYVNGRSLSGGCKVFFRCFFLSPIDTNCVAPTVRLKNASSKFLLEIQAGEEQNVICH